MKIAERILLALSRDPDKPDLPQAVADWSLDSALEILETNFPGLDRLVTGARVLDFGCGAGWQAAALSRRGAGYVLGLDLNQSSLSSARALAEKLGLDANRIQLRDAIPEAEQGTFDLVISQNSMEHFADPAAVLRMMKAALRPHGTLLITFGPPWLAPSGSHMHFFTPVPWVNILFSEETVMRARARYRGDGARRYEEVESGLNRMTVGKFERLVSECGMEVVSRDYHAVKGIQLLARIPALRELFINNVTAVLTPRAAAPALAEPRPKSRLYAGV